MASVQATWAVFAGSMQKVVAGITKTLCVGWRLIAVATHANDFCAHVRFRAHLAGSMQKVVAIVT
jgi:hypothetical protein